ncbi:MAG TPA: serine/threonine-protein kinase [Bryobacteraceae bacterium]|nr:serine/threonine-protein kinase [Bryobacteraceae bacterium]
MNPDRWRQIQDAFHRAEALTGAEREHFLDEVRATDQSLGRQVESLLICGDGDDLDRAISQSARDALDEHRFSGEVFADYRIGRQIGEGGMGVVYEAEQQNPRRTVALKMIRAGRFAGDRARQLFQREAEALGRLKHPGIATIYESGSGADSQPFLAMELVEGTPLHEWLAREAPSDGPWKDAIRGRLRIFRLIADAIGYAHQHGVIHRDIKPSNIMIVEAKGSPPIVKILDFGLARIMWSDGEGMARTEVQTVQGSVPYMSPEQAGGDAGAVDLRTDVYSLGVLLYWMVTGHHPYLEGNEGLPKALVRIAEASPRPFRDWGRRGEDDLELIVRKALEKDPERRYQSVAAFTADVDRYLTDWPIEARAPGLWYQFQKLAKRHRLAVAAASALLVLLVAFGITVSILAARLARERDAANRQATLAQRVSSFLTSLFNSSDPFHNNGADLTAKQVLDQGAARITKELSDEPAVRLQLLQTIGEAYQHLGAYDRAEELFRAEFEASNQVYGTNSPETGRILTQVADVERQRGRLADAERDFRHSWAIQANLPSGKDMELSHTLNDLEIVVQLKGDLEEAEKLARKAVEISGRYPHEIRENLTMRSNLGNVLMERGKLDEAETVLRGVLSGREQVLGPKHPQVLTSLQRLSAVLRAEGHYTEATKFDREALARFQQLEGPDHPDTVAMMPHLASSLVEEGSLAEAEGLYRKAIGHSDRMTLREQPFVAAWHAGLGWVLFKENRLAEADKEFQTALPVLAADPASRLRQAGPLMHYAQLLASLGRNQEARAHLDTVFEIYRNKPPSPLNQAEAVFVSAKLDADEKHNEEAEKEYARAIEMDRSMGKPGQSQLAEHLDGYAIFLASTGSAARAEPLAREAAGICEGAFAAETVTLDIAHSILGGVLMKEGRKQEAGPLVQASYADLKEKLGPHALETEAAWQRLRERP